MINFLLLWNLLLHSICHQIYLYEKDTKSVSYTDFVNKELVLFSNADNERSIPCLVDGKLQYFWLCSCASEFFFFLIIWTVYSSTGDHVNLKVESNGVTLPIPLWEPVNV